MEDVYVPKHGSHQHDISKQHSLRVPQSPGLPELEADCNAQQSLQGDKQFMLWLLAKAESYIQAEPYIDGLLGHVAIQNEQRSALDILLV